MWLMTTTTIMTMIGTPTPTDNRLAQSTVGRLKNRRPAVDVDRMSVSLGTRHHCVKPTQACHLPRLKASRLDVIIWGKK